MEGVPYVTGKLGIAHARCDVMKMLTAPEGKNQHYIWLSYTHIFSSLCNFWEAIVKNKRCFLLTPMLSSSHYRPLEMGGLGVKGGDVPGQK